MNKYRVYAALKLEENARLQVTEVQFTHSSRDASISDVTSEVEMYLRDTFPPLTVERISVFKS